MEKIIGIGEYAVSDSIEDTIKTFALASCVAVVAYSPLKKVAGMIHIALPHPTDSGLSKVRPAYFATTGVPIFINRICKDYNCLKGELSIQIYGGASSSRENDMFKIGQKNIEAVKKILSNLNMKIQHSEVGGTESRTIEIKVATGKVDVVTLPMII